VFNIDDGLYRVKSLRRVIVNILIFSQIIILETELKT